MVKMKIARVYADSSGESHFEDIDIEMSDAGNIGILSDKFEATGIIFRETKEDYNYVWHTAPRRQYVINLSGEFEITVSSGETRRFGDGDIILLEDTTGRGHCSKAVGNQYRKSIFVTLE
jgi:hypothetical protein